MALHVTKANYEMTGGGCYTFWGKLSDGKYFAFSTMNTFGYYDADYGETMTKEFYDLTCGDSYEWEEKHVLSEDVYSVTEKEKCIIKETLKILNLEKDFSDWNFKEEN